MDVRGSAAQRGSSGAKRAADAPADDGGRPVKAGMLLERLLGGNRQSHAVAVPSAVGERGARPSTFLDVSALTQAVPRASGQASFFKYCGLPRPARARSSCTHLPSL